MKRILLGLLFALAMAGGAYAQTISAVTVASCGAQSFGSNTFQPVEIDLTGNLCTNASSGSGVTISGPLGGLNQTDASGVRVSLSGSVPNTWTTPCPGALGDAGFFSCMITEMGLPPTAYVSTTPTAEGGTADGSYADWWTDVRKIGGIAVVPDPCSTNKKATAFANITSSGASIITATASDYTYICQISVSTTTITDFSLVAGTGSSVCTSGSPYPIWGNPAETASNGFQIGTATTAPGGGGVIVGNGGYTVAGGSVGGTVNYNICVLITTTNSPTVNVTLLYVQTPN